MNNQKIGHFLQHNKWVVPLIFVVASIVTLLFCSIDSYLYAQIGQFDSAVFFMCGKALVNGMIPYSEFTDSKGILLWLFYGLGYLFDHYSYVGIYWINCIIVSLTLCLAYKTSRLFLDKWTSVISALFLLVPLLYWNFYFETKAEHFCWPAVAWGIYLMLRGIFGQSIEFKHYVWLGISVIVCLLLKWSIAAMMFCFVVAMACIAWQHNKVCPCIIAMFLGAIVAMMPFAIYFSIVGNWGEMWKEYFVNTLSSVSVPLNETIEAYVGEWFFLLSTQRIIYLLYVFFAVFLFKRQNWFVSSLPLLCGLFFVALSIRHDGAHYVTVTAPFAIIAIIIVIRTCLYCRVKRLYLLILCLGLNAFNMWGNVHFSKSFCTCMNSDFDQYMALSATMARNSDNPTVIVIGMEPGLCMGDALPGTRYWTMQKGRTEEMWESEWSAIKEKKADFVVLWSVDPKYYEADLLSIGYHYLSDYYAGTVYSKEIVSMPEEIIKLSAVDIVRKVNYKEVYK